MLTRTTTALLEGLIDPSNAAVWREFDARYRSVLCGFGHRLGLSAEDAADVAQETLVRFVKAYREGKYDRQRGRLRSWIIGIARHCMLDLQTSRAARREQRGLSAIADLPDESRMTAIWDTEFEQAMLRQGLIQLRQQSKTDERTLRAFELVAFERQPAAEVASALGMSLNDVYLAKHRCLSRLRQIINELKELYEAA